MARLCEISEKEYLDRKFEAAKEVLPTMLDKVDIAYITDVRKRGSLIFNTCAIADHLLQELGYRVKGNATAASMGQAEQDSTGIRKLSEMLLDDADKKKTGDE